MTTQLAKTVFLKSLQNLTHGALELVCGERRYYFGECTRQGACATIHVHNDDFFRKAVFGGDIGAGESYMDGDWTSPDLMAVIRLAVRNLAAIESSSRLLGAVNWVKSRLAHRLRSNTVAGSRANIEAHYDLSNDFFRLFLDGSMMYSSAFYGSAGDTLETAQLRKMDRICTKLQLSPGDRVLEIGTGWGGFAIHAARHYGCHVTTTTISREQHAWATQWVASTADVRDRITLLLQDYRNLRGQFDKIVSIEMFEAVGLDHYDDYFGACDRLLKPDGSMLFQTITMNEQKFPVYRRQTDWIQKYIFPGSDLASVSEVLRSLARSTDLTMVHLEDIGGHYARTLADWRARFWSAIHEVRAQGFDERFIRMWDYYLAYCEGAFAERHIGDSQILLTKLGSGKPLWNEPSGVREDRAVAVGA